MEDRELWAVDLGTMDYQTALDLQHRLVDLKKRRELEADLFLLLEHPPVLTLGRRGDDNNVLASPEELANRNIQLYHVERGGDVTYHGPGQLVGYPIVSLRRLPRRKDVSRFVWVIQEAIIRTLASYGIAGERIDKVIGVWVRGRSPDLQALPWDERYRTEVEQLTAFEERKIAAIGARVEAWTSYHGFALNVNTDLTDFNLIVPCGLRDRGVTSMQAEIGREIDMAEVKRRVAEHLSGQWQHRLVWIEASALREDILERAE